MAATTTPNDRNLALAITALGAAAVTLALRAHWNPGDTNPSIDGCLTCGVVGFLLALLHPMSYRLAVVFTAPVVAVQYVACALAGASAAGVVGLELLILGSLGLVLSRREPRPVEVAEPERDHLPAGHASW